METTVNSQSTVGTSSVLVTTLSPTRRYAVFCNDSSNTIYLSIGAAATIGNGIRLNANGGTFEINLQNPIRGEIYAIASGASSNLSFVTIS